MMRRAAVLLLTAYAAVSPALADPPDFSLSLDVSPELSNDLASGKLDPYVDTTLSGDMSGSFDNGISYLFSGSAIVERHADFTYNDSDYLNFIGQVSIPLPASARLKMRATNLSLFTTTYEELVYNVTDLSLGVERTFDLTDISSVRLGMAAGRRYATLPFLERNSVTPSVAFSSKVWGLDASLSASYSYRDFVDSDRIDNYFGASASLSKDFDDFSVGLNASVDVTRSNLDLANSTQFTFGPNFTYNFPID